MVWNETKVQKFQHKHLKTMKTLLPFLDAKQKHWLILDRNIYRLCKIYIQI